MQKYFCGQAIPDWIKQMTFLGLICKKYFCGQAYIFLIELNGDILEVLWLSNS